MSNSMFLFVLSLKCGVTQQGIDSLTLCTVLAFYGSEECPGLVTGVNSSVLMYSIGLSQQVGRYS